MSEQVTVKSFGEGNPWNDLTFYDVIFDRGGSDFTASWGKKGGEPTVGEQIEGEFFQKDGKWRFRKTSKPQSGGGSGGSSGGKREWKPESQYDPEKTARIGRAHAQGMAVQVLLSVPGFAEAPKEKRRTALADWIEWFEADVNAAATKAAFSATDVPAEDPGQAPPPDDFPF